MTKPVRYGLVGRKLGHSFSCAYFTEFFEKEGIDASYVNFEIETIADLPLILGRFGQLRGFNVTIPYKTDIFRYLDTIDDTAREIGAVNVVKVREREDGNMTLHGYNTDAPGFRETFEPLLTPYRHRGALVLGTGGASKAIRWTLKNLGIPYLIVSRTPAGDDEVGYDMIDGEMLAQYPVIINCTPVGMYPNVESFPAIPYDLLGPENLCYDLVYNPLETEFMKRASARGATVANGLGMLYRQAQLAWDIWSEE